MRAWRKLPSYMRVPEVEPYYKLLKKRLISLALKRCFDIVVSLSLLILLFIPMIVIAIMIKCDSKGSVLYRQERVTRYGEHFKIHKFRTMINHADQMGSTVTVENDSRITRIGSILRNRRLDELPQLIDVLIGDMSFVGTRPEAVKYVERYKPEYYATLLLPAGITSEASIRYKDEAELLGTAENVDRVYIEQVLPEKMNWNLKSIREFHFLGEMVTMFRTVFVIMGKVYK